MGKFRELVKQVLGEAASASLGTVHHSTKTIQYLPSLTEVPANGRTETTVGDWKQRLSALVPSHITVPYIP